MDPRDFTTTFTVDRTPHEVFAAVNDVRGWWTGDIEGNTEQVGDEFTYRYQDVHVSRQRITESVPGERIVWHVLEARLAFTADTAEWKDTEIVFDIAPKGAGTEVRFTHAGLVPAFECFDSCSGAWRHLVGHNLHHLITTGHVDHGEWGTTSGAAGSDRRA